LRNRLLMLANFKNKACVGESGMLRFAPRA
jgi:hypothetical protein